MRCVIAGTSPAQSCMSRAFNLVVILALGCLACVEAPTTGGTRPVLEDLGEGAWSTVSVGTDHTCALSADGRAFCWGANDGGQLLLPESGPSTCSIQGSSLTRSCSPVPVPVLATVRFRAIATGGAHSCGIAMDRSVYCWGDNQYGQLGASDPVRGMVHVQSSLGFADISAGVRHSCGVRTDGAVMCWGGNERGQLGTGDRTPSASPIRALSGQIYASVSAGDGRTCARNTTGSVFCWGAIWLYRQNGLEWTRDQMTPQRVENAPSMTTLSVGSLTTCGSDAAGVAYCWEANPHGQMGNGTTEGSTIPTPVASSVRFAKVSAGIIQSCAISVTGAGYCWGNDSFGQLGVAPSTLTETCASEDLRCSTRPIPVDGRQQFVSISTGFGNHSCGVSTKGNLYCWGLGWLGQLGDGKSSYREVAPVLVQPPIVE
jgi:alpha-tubulin suppressor-like RCC1 family protein